MLHMLSSNSTQTCFKAFSGLWKPAENSSYADICQTSIQYHLLFLQCQIPSTFHRKLLCLTNQFSFWNIFVFVKFHLRIWYYDMLSNAHLYFAMLCHFKMSFLNILNLSLDFLQCLNLISCELGHLSETC